MTDQREVYDAELNERRLANEKRTQLIGAVEPELSVAAMISMQIYSAEVSAS